LDKDLRNFFPLIKEATMIAKELGRKINFELRQAPQNYSKHARFGDKVIIKVDYHTENYFQLWSVAEFEDRLQAMRNALEEFRETGKFDMADKKKDPFYDPPQPVCVGMSFMPLAPLAECKPLKIVNKIVMSRTVP